MKKIIIIFLTLPLFGCITLQSLKNHSAKHAVAVIHNLNNYKKMGVIHFKETPQGTKITVNISNLSPGKHGFHIHQFGDLSKNDGKSAGGHFNPHNHHHAGRKHRIRHIGDLGNLEVSKNGKAFVIFTDEKIKLSGKNNIIGRSVIIHAKHDNLSSQPSGNAGKRIAGGIIGIAK